jgi:hypothetical protein
MNHLPSMCEALTAFVNRGLSGSVKLRESDKDHDECLIS